MYINNVTNIYYLQLLYKKWYTCFVSFNKINSSFTKFARTSFISGVFGWHAICFQWYINFYPQLRLDLVGFGHMSVGKKIDNPDISAYTERPVYIQL